MNMYTPLGHGNLRNAFYLDQCAGKRQLSNSNTSSRRHLALLEELAGRALRCCSQHSPMHLPSLYTSFMDLKSREMSVIYMFALVTCVISQPAAARTLFMFSRAARWER